jgi:hypothetical protein
MTNYTVIVEEYKRVAVAIQGKAGILGDKNNYRVGFAPLVF